MMKRLLYLTLIIFLSSCAFHKGTFDSSVSLQENNFEIVNVLESSSDATYVLGIGGNDLTGLYKEAKNELYEKYPLKKGQALANITTDVKTTYLFIIILQKMTLTADVVQFKTASDSIKYQSYRNTRQFQGVMGKKKGELSTDFGTPKPGTYRISSHSHGFIVLYKENSYLLPQPDGSIVSGSYFGRGPENDLYAFTSENG
jgi:hypothetical protein